MVFEIKDPFGSHLRIKKILTPYNPVKKMIPINNYTKSKQSHKYLFYPKRKYFSFFTVIFIFFYMREMIFAQRFKLANYLNFPNQVTLLLTQIKLFILLK